jgi:multiple sugar transport system permease protein
MSRHRRWRTWPVHVLLIGGTCVFLFPFLWMIVTSLKTDEEVQDGRWWPRIPRYRESSPYSDGDRRASLQFLALQLRMLDGQIINVCSADDIARTWRPDTSAAKLSPPGTSADGAELSYSFADPNRSAITFRADFEIPGGMAMLHKMILTLRPDDSWHRLDATLDIGGARYVSQRPTYLAQHRATGVIFQPPGFDDQTLQARTWVPLKQVPGASAAEPRATRAVLTLTLSASSTLTATYAKAVRNYSRAFYAVPFWRYVGNSVLLVALTTIGTLFSSTFVAYAFARLHWPGRGAALIVLLATMMLPAQVTVVPSFLIWRQLGWYNTLNPLWVPAFAGGAFFIFLMTQHMKTLPRELEESARLDGLSAVQTWYYIIVPQVKPAAAAIAVMTFMWSWNEFLGPLIYLRDQSKFPLSLGLFAMRLENFGDWSMIMAANVLMTLPVIVIFFLCQRYFIQGMTMSGLKG